MRQLLTLGSEIGITRPKTDPERSWASWDPMTTCDTSTLGPWNPITPTLDPLEPDDPQPLSFTTPHALEPRTLKPMTQTLDPTETLWALFYTDTLDPNPAPPSGSYVQCMSIQYLL